MIELNKIFQGHSHDLLKLLPDNFVNCIVTSPPYLWLRNYKTELIDWPEVRYFLFGFEIVIPPMKCSLGLEPDTKSFVAHIVLIFRECKRTLRDDGTLWMNFGDSYYGSNQGFGDIKTTNKGHKGSHERTKPNYADENLKPKDLLGIPWMVAFALRDDGWYLRQDNIWHKPNPMPESVEDRCTKAHEYLFMFSRSSTYYFDADAIKTQSYIDPAKSKMPDGWETEKGAHGAFHRNGREKGGNWKGSSFDKGKTGEMKHTNGHLKSLPAGQQNIREARTKQRSGNLERKPRPGIPEENTSAQSGSVPWEGYMANKRSVWTVSTQSFSEAHFATFPEKLIVDCIKAGTSIDGIVLDPFMGAGTTALVARKLNRNFIGFELNQKYIDIAEKRLYNELGMFK